MKVMSLFFDAVCNSMIHLLFDSVFMQSENEIKISLPNQSKNESRMHIFTPMLQQMFNNK